jgi:hypothetical protein
MSHDPRSGPEPDPGDAGWIARVRNRLDTQARDLDGATASRLNRARQAALAEAARGRRPGWAWPAAFATAFALAAAVVVWRPAGEPAPLPSDITDDFALIAEGEDLALYEDLEFYAWLDAQQAAGG